MRFRLRAVALLIALIVSPAVRAADTKPVMTLRVAPEYPPELRAQRVIGGAELTFLVDENGLVKQIEIAGQSQPAFGAAAKKALEQCRFTPGTKDGRVQAMRSGLTVEFTFTDAELAKMEQERAAETLPPGPPLLDAYETSEMPELKKEIRPDLPREMKPGTRIENTVVRLVVDEQGMPRDVHILVTTSVNCGLAAEAAVKKWRFIPGKKEGQTVRVAMEVPIAFFPGNRWATGARIKPGVSRDIVTSLPGRAVRDVALFTGAPDEEPPKVVHREDLDYPDEMTGHSGTVMMECIINPYGVVTHVRAINTTNQYFTIAAERCFSRWRFTPPKKNGQPVYVRGFQPAQFVYIR